MLVNISGCAINAAILYNLKKATAVYFAAMAQYLVRRFRNLKAVVNHD
jgi:hypothetical protein